MGIDRKGREAAVCPAKPRFVGSIPTGASRQDNELALPPGEAAESSAGQNAGHSSAFAPDTLELCRRGEDTGDDAGVLAIIDHARVAPRHRPTETRATEPRASQ